VWDFGWEIAHAAVSRRPPIPLDTIVARTQSYTYDATVWDLSIVQGAFPVTPCPNLTFSIRNLSVAAQDQLRRGGAAPHSRGRGGAGAREKKKG
jgi:hypothetical protein